MQLTYDEYLDYYIPKINRCIQQYFEKEKIKTAYQFTYPFYDDIIEYCLRPAKRIRSILLLLAYQGYKNVDMIDEEIIKIAALIEIMHSFFLIQDDIIDNAKIRRGGEAFHLISDKKYTQNSHNNNGVNIATIMTDVIIFTIINFISDLKIDLNIKNDFLKIFAETYQTTSWGQMLDVLNTLPKKIEPDSDIPYKISMLKTAYYTICNPMLMGYILSGKKEKIEEAKIKKFAIPLGLAFQFRDDIWGIFGNNTKIGKSVDSDLTEGKYTLLIQETINILEGNEKEKFIEIFTKNKKNNENIKVLKSFINNSKAKDIVLDKMNQLIKESQNYLSDLNINNNSVVYIIFELIKSINSLE